MSMASRLTARRCRDSIWQIIWQKISAMADSPQPLPELVSFLEERFAIQIGDAEIVPANLDSIAAIVAFVASKNPAAAAA